MPSLFLIAEAVNIHFEVRVFQSASCLSRRACTLVERVWDIEYEDSLRWIGPLISTMGPIIHMSIEWPLC
jgi:hypothetical protein